MALLGHLFIFILTFASSNMLMRVDFVRNVLFGFVFKYVLMAYCVYPKTESFEKIKNRAIIEIEEDGSQFSKLPIWRNINLMVSGVGDEIKPFFDILEKYPSDFFLDQVDYIIVSKMGMELLKITRTPQNFNRSLYLEITAPRSQTWLFFQSMEFIFAMVVTAVYDMFTDGRILSVIKAREEL